MPCIWNDYGVIAWNRIDCTSFLSFGTYHNNLAVRKAHRTKCFQGGNSYQALWNKMGGSSESKVPSRSWRGLDDIYMMDKCDDTEQSSSCDRAHSGGRWWELKPESGIWLPKGGSWLDEGYRYQFQQAGTVGSRSVLGKDCHSKDVHEVVQTSPLRWMWDWHCLLQRGNTRCCSDICWTHCQQRFGHHGKRWCDLGGENLCIRGVQHKCKEAEDAIRCESWTGCDAVVSKPHHVFLVKEAPRSNLVQYGWNANLSRGSAKWRRQFCCMPVDTVLHV